MCIAIPMQVTGVNGLCATCAARGATRRVSLLLLAGAGDATPVAPGDFVSVHRDQAIARITPEEARETWALLDEVLGALEPRSGARS